MESEVLVENDGGQVLVENDGGEVLAENPLYKAPYYWRRALQSPSTRAGLGRGGDRGLGW